MTRTRTLPRFTAIAVFVMAVAFTWFFQRAKHDSVLIKVNPFTDDPFDATGSFATIFVMLIAVSGLFTAFISRKPMTAERQLVILRRHIMGALAIVITLLSDFVALARYPEQWVNRPGGQILVLLVTVFLIGILSFCLFLYFSFKGRIDAAGRRERLTAPACWIVAIGLEALLPANLHSLGIPGAIAAVVVGVLVLFATVRTTAVVIVPYSKADLEVGRRYWWWQAAVFGLAVGFLISQAEGFGETGRLGDFSLIALLITLIGAGGVFIGYAFLARPLGFYGPRETTARPG